MTTTEPDAASQTATTKIYTLQIWAQNWAHKFLLIFYESINCPPLLWIEAVGETYEILMKSIFMTCLSRANVEKISCFGWYRIGIDVCGELPKRKVQRLVDLTENR